MGERLVEAVGLEFEPEPAQGILAVAVGALFEQVDVLADTLEVLPGGDHLACQGFGLLAERVLVGGWQATALQCSQLPFKLGNLLIAGGQAGGVLFQHGAQQLFVLLVADEVALPGEPVVHAP
jgi:hypothetical protein